MDFEESMPIGMVDEKYAKDRFELLMQACEKVLYSIFANGEM